MPPVEKQSGEQSWTSLAYYPKGGKDQWNCKISDYYVPLSFLQQQFSISTWVSILFFWADLALLRNPMEHLSTCTQCMQGMDHMFHWITYEPHLPEEKRPSCYAKSPTCFSQYQASSAALGWLGWGLLSHAQNAIRWLTLTIWWVKLLKQHAAARSM